MPSFQEVLSSVAQKVDTTYAIKDWQVVVSEIEAITRELNGFGTSGKVFSQFDVAELANMWWRLAVLRASLIDLKDTAFRNMLNSKQFVAVKEASIREAVKTKAEQTQHKISQGDIEAEVKRQSSAAVLEYQLHLAKYEKVQSYWYWIPDILYRIESKISILSRDQNTAKFYNQANNSSENVLDYKFN